jgi:hypothetical protein
MKTFKQFLEALNQDDLKYYKVIENPESIPEFSWKDCEDQYRVGKVIFDNKKGLGSTPNTQNIKYIGMVAMMTIDNYLAIAADHEGQREQSALDIKEAIEAGYGIGAPWLEIEMDDFTDEKPARCIGHEGRARLISCKKYFGLTEVPVQIWFPGFRNRHITSEVLQWLKDGITKEKGSTFTIDPFTKVFTGQ